MNNGKLFLPITRNGLMLLLLVFAVALFYGLTLREGHNWGGDFSQYLHHARNIAEGRSYDDINIIQNPLNHVAPQMYPPMVPLVLAPVFYYFGLDLTAIKLVQLACFCLSLLVIARLFSRSLSTLGVLAVLLLFSLNPYVWAQKDVIQSEFLFLFFSFFSLLLMELRYSSDVQYGWSGFGVCLGLTMYFAYATREIGIVLVLTLVSLEIIALRRISRTAMISLAVFLLLVLLQKNILVPHHLHPALQEKLSTMAAEVSMGEFTHSSIFRFDINYVIEQVLRYGESLKDFWSPNYRPALILATIVSLLAVVGYARRLWLRISAPEIFTAGYLAVILLFAGFQGTRYLLPILPLYLYYAFVGMQFGGDCLGRQLALTLSVIVLVGAGTVYMHEYRAQNFQVIENGISREDAVAMFDYIRNATGPDDIVIFRKPRVMALLTERLSSIYPARSNASLLFNFLDEVGADYVVVGHFESDTATLKPIIECYPHRFVEAFSRGEFTVYRYISTNRLLKKAS